MIIIFFITEFVWLNNSSFSPKTRKNMLLRSTLQLQIKLLPKLPIITKLHFILFYFLAVVIPKCHFTIECSFSDPKKQRKQSKLCSNLFSLSRLIDCLNWFFSHFSHLMLYIHCLLFPKNKIHVKANKIRVCESERLSEMANDSQNRVIASQKD